MNLPGRILLLAWLLFTVSATAEDDLPEAADQFECATCHTERLREFRRRNAVALIEHEPSPSLPTSTQDESSTPRMCFSCHDGYVMDSRSLWKEGHRGHPTGMQPSSRIAAPQAGGEPVFPMNDDGRMYCGSCHSPHNNEAATGAAPSFLRVALDDGNLCLACHTDKASVIETDHAPRSARRANAPADFSKRGVCMRCHAAHEGQGPVMWSREPGPGNTITDTLCNSCHEGDVPPNWHPPHVRAWSAEIRALLVDDPGAALKVFNDDGSRALTGAIGCATCHDAHRQQPGDGDWPGNFLRRERTARILCADCHGDSALRRYQFFHSKYSRPRG